MREIVIICSAEKFAHTGHFANIGPKAFIHAQICFESGGRKYEVVYCLENRAIHNLCLLIFHLSFKI